MLEDELKIRDAVEDNFGRFSKRLIKRGASTVIEQEIN
jgi:hypothetical protein